jgi:long-chain acyl-CoA synthetase
MQQLLTDGLRRAESLWGRRVAAIDGPVSLTYDELADRCRRLAAALHEQGVTAGDRVATLLTNGHRYLECYYAIPGAGAVIVPLNNRLSAPELRYILEDAAVHTLIVDDTYAALAEELSPAVKQTVIGATDYEARLARALPRELSVGVQETDLAGLFYTGGTTGAAKGVMLTHRNLVSNALHIGLSLHYTDADRYLHVAPMFHLADGASTYALTWSGGSHVFLPGFDAKAVVDTIAELDVTAVLMVPAMLTAIVNLPEARTVDLSALRLVFHGAAPISTSLLRASIETMGCSFAQGYGMTEAAPLVTVLHDE